MPTLSPHTDERRPMGELAEAGWSRFVALDRQIVTTLRRISVPVLRVSLGLVFVWFGALKIFDVTPVNALVADTVYWVDPSWFVPVLGVFEVLVGLGLLLGVWLRVVLLLFAAQLVGTFLVLIVQSDVAFQQGNPLLLTTEGEFVIKNLVLLSAGMVVGASLRRPRPWRVHEESGRQPRPGDPPARLGVSGRRGASSGVAAAAACSGGHRAGRSARSAARSRSGQSSGVKWPQPWSWTTSARGSSACSRRPATAQDWNGSSMPQISWHGTASPARAGTTAAVSAGVSAARWRWNAARPSGSVYFVSQKTRPASGPTAGSVPAPSVRPAPAKPRRISRRR